MKSIMREWTKLNIFYYEDLKIQVLKMLSKKVTKVMFWILLRSKLTNHYYVTKAIGFVWVFLQFSNHSTAMKK
jgi:hypothetical protein